MDPLDLIQEQRERRQMRDRLRTENEDLQQSYFGRIEGFDNTVGMYWVRVRGGTAMHARVLSNANFDVGEVVNCTVPSSGLVWVDKISAG